MTWIKSPERRRWHCDGGFVVNLFHTFFYRFYCWLWTSKCKLDYKCLFYVVLIIFHFRYCQTNRSGPLKVFLRKSVLKICSKFYWRTPMPKLIFKATLLKYTSAWVFSYKFAAYFQNTFLSEQRWIVASELRQKCKKVWSALVIPNSVIIVLLYFLNHALTLLRNSVNVTDGQTMLSFLI